jgi:hypothetical protein
MYYTTPVSLIATKAGALASLMALKLIPITMGCIPSSTNTWLNTDASRNVVMPVMICALQGNHDPLEITAKPGIQSGAGALGTKVL